jgi:hypothetical protein
LIRLVDCWVGRRIGGDVVFVWLIMVDDDDVMG